MARVHLIALRLLRRPDGNEPGLPPLPIGATGAVIGRAPDCDLVLEDPLRLVSRQHAQILPQGNDGALLRCISTSVSIGVNGDSVPPGGEVLVKAGDRLRIGGFELQVEVPEARSAVAAISEPSAPPAALAPAPGAAPGLAAEPVVAAAPVAADSPVSPVAPIAVAVPAPVSVPVAVADATPPSPTAFADSARGRLDQWFDLDTVADPLAPGSPLPMPVMPGPAAASPTGPGNARPAPVHRHDPDAAAVPSARQPAVTPASTAFAAAPSALSPSAPSPSAATPPDTTADAALVHAFLRGAGLDAHPQAASIGGDVAWMRHLGSLLRAATEGTLALLRSRAVTKRSIRAEGTQIAPRENNPLKFAPDAAEALVLLLGRQGTPGFLDPVEALRDAHADLLVHQLAMVAGMRAAVFELISRFGPDAIEAQQGAPKGLARFVPSLHQATLWQRHRDQHAHLVANLDDDFEAVFGREFLRAYEDQSRLARLAAEQRAAAIR